MKVLLLQNMDIEIYLDIAELSTIKHAPLTKEMKDVHNIGVEGILTLTYEYTSLSRGDSIEVFCDYDANLYHININDKAYNDLLINRRCKSKYGFDKKILISTEECSFPKKK